MKLNWPEAAQAAQLCLQIYNPNPKDFLTYIGHASTLAGIARRGSTLYVVFQGTNEAADWMINLRFWQRRQPFDSLGGKVHRGFAEVARRYVDDIRRLVDPKLQLVLTGHSLGGALATLVGYALAEHKPTIYTFGQPKVGDARLAQLLNLHLPRYYRFVHTNDIVAFLPLLGYRHAGIRFYIDSARRVHLRHRPSLHVLLDRLLTLARFYIYPGWGLHTIEAHNMEFYAEALARHATLASLAR